MFNFSFGRLKKQTFIANLIPNNSETTVSIANKVTDNKVTDNILFYISGYMIRDLSKYIDYQYCATLVVQPAVSTSVCHLFQSQK